MKTRFSFLFAVSLACACVSFAQSTQEEIMADMNKMNSNYALYPEPSKNIQRTKAPKGYSPIYISHYGRHGSRNHYNAADYTFIYSTLAKADSANKLTEKGKSLLKRTKYLNDFIAPKAGDLTQKGVAQHQGIAKRMVKNFPQLFKDSAYIEAYASVSGRCIVSMAAFLEELRGINSKLKIHQESSKSLMKFINPFELEFADSYMNTPEWKAENEKLYSHVKPARLMALLFNDTAYVSKNVKAYDLFSKLYEITGSLASVDNLDFDFNDIWTKEDYFARWQAQNAWWYNVLGNSPLTHKKGVDYAKPLLKNIFTEADKALAQDTLKSGKKISATLRFGHDMTVLPLANLLQLDVAKASVTNMEKLHTEWNDFKIIPMAANIQFIFYQSKKKGEPILVKVLFNEQEQNLPVTCPAEAKCPKAPYYRYEDVKATYNH